MARERCSDDSYSEAMFGIPTAWLVVATLGATVFQLNKGIEHALMPVAMLLRSVPLVAMGRFNHEAACVDPVTGIVYLTEDRGDSDAELRGLKQTAKSHTKKIKNRNM